MADVNLLLEGQPAHFFRVEELDETVRLCLRDREVLLLPHEVEDLVRLQVVVRGTIKSLEGRLGAEVTDRAEPLASYFEVLLPFSDCDE